MSPFSQQDPPTPMGGAVPAASVASQFSVWQESLHGDSRIRHSDENCNEQFHQGLAYGGPAARGAHSSCTSGERRLARPTSGIGTGTVTSPGAGADAGTGATAHQPPALQRGAPPHDCTALHICPDAALPTAACTYVSAAFPAPSMRPRERRGSAPVPPAPPPSPEHPRLRPALEGSFSVS